MENKTWQEQLDEVMKQIQGRQPFSYNIEGDALYQQYKNHYNKQAELAMKDAIGQASALTGGYGNSYAQSAGNQAYQAQMNNLNDIIPDLYQVAYDKYNKETDDLYNQYSLIANHITNKKKLEEGDDSGGDPNPGDLPNPSDPPTSLITDEIRNKAASFKNKGDLDDYLAQLSAIEKLTDSDVAQLQIDNDDIYEIYDENDQPDYKAMVGNPNGWTAVSDGGKNYLGGIDKDAQIEAPDGRIFKADELANWLVEEKDMKKRDARNAVKHLLEALGIND